VTAHSARAEKDAASPDAQPQGEKVPDSPVKVSQETAKIENKGAESLAGKKGSPTHKVNPTERTAKSSGKNTKSAGKTTKSVGKTTKTARKATKSPRKADKSPGKSSKPSGKVAKPADTPPKSSVKTQTGPAEAQDQPAKVQEPAKAQKEPAKVKEAPIKAKRVPVKAKDVPVKTKEVPATTHKEPVEAQEQPVKAKAGPIKAQKTPDTEAEPPVGPEKASHPPEISPMPPEESSRQAEKIPKDAEKSSVPMRDSQVRIAPPPPSPPKEEPGGAGIETPSGPISTGPIPSDPIPIGPKSGAAIPSDPIPIGQKPAAAIPTDPIPVGPKPAGMDAQSPAWEETDTREQPVPVPPLSSPPSFDREEPQGVPIQDRIRGDQGPTMAESLKRAAFRIKARRRTAPFLMAIFLAALGIVATLMIVKPGSQDIGQPLLAPSEHPQVAVLPFANATGDSTYDVWSKALSYALESDLSQAADLTLVPSDPLFALLRELDLLEATAKGYSKADLKKIITRSGANTLVMGRISSSDGGLQINMQVKAGNKDRRFAYHDFTCRGLADILPLVDQMTRRIIDALPLSEEAHSQVIDRDFADFTTHSPAAFAHFVAGKLLQGQKKFRQGIDAFEQALAEDPEFSYVYLDLASTYSALGYHYRSWKKCQAAQRLVGHLPERERMHIQGEFYRRSEKTYDIAVNIYSRLLELYPDDLKAKINLGILYSRLGDWDKAQSCFRQAQSNPVATLEAILGISQVHVLQRDYDGAAEVLTDYMISGHDSEEVRRLLGWVFLMKGEYAVAAEHIKEGQILDQTYRLSRMKGDLSLIRQDVKSAYDEYSKLLSDPEPMARLWGFKRLADLCLLEGKFRQAVGHLNAALSLAEEQQEMAWKYRLHLDVARIRLEINQPSLAMEQCDAAWSIAVQGETMDYPRDALHYRGLCYIAMNRIRDALRTAERLSGLCQKGPVSDRMRYYSHLMGRIEMARKNPKSAVEHFAAAVDLLPAEGEPGRFLNDHALFRDALAEAFYTAENPIKALEEFENFRDLTSGRLGYSDLYAKVYYKLGKIREEYGLNDSAVSIYEKFLKLWKNADPGISEVLDARQRIEATRLP
jgi:tetratricopeptide (TPR) repeat protein